VNENKPSSRRDLDNPLERLFGNANVAKVLGPMSASSGTTDSDGR
jgi:hypothetical protein